MLGSGKTPVGKSKEEKRTVEPGRRLGKRALKIRSLLLLTGTDTKCAIITQQSRQIHLSQLTFRKDFRALNHHLHLKNCKR